MRGKESVYVSQCAQMWKGYQIPPTVSNRTIHIAYERHCLLGCSVNYNYVMNNPAKSWVQNTISPQYSAENEQKGTDVQYISPRYPIISHWGLRLLDGRYLSSRRWLIQMNIQKYSIGGKWRYCKRQLESMYYTVCIVS